MMPGMTGAGPDVTLIRHGETTWSASGQHTGRTDLDLTEVGEDQARGLRSLLWSRQFDVVLCSPRRRARRTAELAGLTVSEIDDDLREWDYGDLEGRTTAEIRAEMPDWSIWGGPWPGGETAAEVSARADRVVARVRQQPANCSVALVAHGHILRVLGARWIGAGITFGQVFALDTASVSELGWEQQVPVIWRWNITPGPRPV